MKLVFSDFALPPGAAPADRTAETVAGQPVERGRWSSSSVAAAVARLAPPDLAPEELLAAWESAIADLADPTSPLRERLDPLLAVGTGLSERGLKAALEIVLEGARGEATRRLLRSRRGDELSLRSPVAVVAAANIPGLVVQPLLPILAAGRPAILRSSSREPFFAPMLVAALCRRNPRLARSLLALTWPGEDPELEASAFDPCGLVLAYGGQAAMHSLGDRWGPRLLRFGPRLSFALVGTGIDLEATARGVARDIALFDQRGCLSVQAVFTLGAGERLAAALSRELTAIATRIPAGKLSAEAAAAARLVREEAVARGLWLPSPLPSIEIGTVVVESSPVLVPSPGSRTVRIYPLASLGDLWPRLEGWGGLLQGAAVTADLEGAVALGLRRLGVTRIAPPGELQSVDASWENGGVELAELLMAMAG